MKPIFREVKKKKKKKGGGGEVWTMVKALVLGSKNLLQVTLEFDNKLQNEIYKKYISPNYGESASECVSIVNMYYILFIRYNDTYVNIIYECFKMEFYL